MVGWVGGDWGGPGCSTGHKMMLRGSAVVLSEYILFPVHLLLCYAGLIFCFHCSCSIHLKGGKPPTGAETIFELGSALRLCTVAMKAHTHTHIYIATQLRCPYGDRFAKHSIAHTQKGINVLAAGPRDLSS